MEVQAIGQSIEQNKAFLERLFWHMLGIVNLVHQRGIAGGRPLSWQEIGTGTACHYRGSNFILKAKHVLQEAGPLTCDSFRAPAEGSNGRMSRGNGFAPNAWR
jgi:hypothetical protein